MEILYNCSTIIKIGEFNTDTLLLSDSQTKLQIIPCFSQLIVFSHAEFNLGLQIIFCCHANIVPFIPKYQL